MSRQSLRFRIAIRQSGVSLIELMIAMIIATLLGIGLVQIFASTRAAFNTNSSLARAQENSRFAMDYLQQDLRLVGHLGTRNEQSARPGASGESLQNQLFNHLSSATGTGRPANAPWLFRIDVPVQGFEYNGTGVGGAVSMSATPTYGGGTYTPALPSGLSFLNSGANAAVRGSDILLVRTLSAEFVTLINTETRPDSFPVVSGTPFDSSTGTFLWDNSQSGLAGFIRQFGVYAFSNASAISLFQVTATPAVNQGVAGTGGGSLNNWSFQAPPQSANGKTERPSDYGRLLPVHRYNVVVYYVAQGADGQPALFRRQLNPSPATLAEGGAFGNAEELVPGIDSLQAVFGVAACTPVAGGCARGSDQPNRYLTANGVDGGSWRNDTDTSCGAAGACLRWGDVVNVRVGLLTRSAMNATGQQESQVPRNVAGVTFTPNTADRRFRQVYETQVAFRNRNRG